MALGLFVGDRLADVAARAAGLRVAIVRGGECAATAFDAMPPDHFVDTLAQVEQLVAGHGVRSEI